MLDKLIANEIISQLSRYGKRDTAHSRKCATITLIKL